MSVGARESAQDWRDLLLELKRRGLDVPPRLTIADGALGFGRPCPLLGSERNSRLRVVRSAFDPGCVRTQMLNLRVEFPSRFGRRESQSHYKVLLAVAN